MHPWYVANNLIKYYICVIVFCCIYFYSILVKETEKAMAPHSSTLAWKILWTEEPGRLQSVGSRRVGHDWATSLSLFTFHFHALEKEMATHSIVLAWRIPGKGEPGGLPSMGSHRVGHDWSDLAAAAAAAGPDESLLLGAALKLHLPVHPVSGCEFTEQADV